MRVILLALLCCLPAFAGKSLEVTGDTGTYTSPASSPWTTLGARRIELRGDFTGFSCTSSTLWSVGGVAIRCSSTQLTCFYDSQQAFVAFSGRTDVLVRCQFDPDNDRLTMEIWDVDGANYDSDIQTGITDNTNDASGSNNIGGSRTFDLAWVRQYEGALAMGSTAPSNPSSNNGDLGDWEFEDALTDSSTYSMTASISGTAYVTSPVINPVSSPQQLSQPTWQTITVQRSATAVSWDGTQSSSGADADPALTYLWSDQTGGGGLTISSSTASQPTISCPSFGEYVVRLVVTDDDANTDSTDITFGCVPTDSNDVVAVADADVDFILGPMIRWGASAWPYIDEQHAAYADYYGPEVVAESSPRYSDDWNDNLTGTISVTNGDATVTGSGTTFQTDFCSGGTTPVGSTNFVIHAADGQDWDYTVSSCTSQTSLELSDNYGFTTGSGLNFSKWDDCLGCWFGGSDNNNYYDNVMAFYALYYRTGLTVYRTYARTLADLWLDMPRINDGAGASTASRAIANRSWAFAGLALHGIETSESTSWWDGWNSQLDTWEASVNTTSDFVDVREDGYALAFVALAAQVHYDTAEQTSLTSTLTSGLGATARFITTDWKVNDVWSNRGFGFGVGGSTITVTNGSTAVTGSGTSWNTFGDHSASWLGVPPVGSTDRRDVTTNEVMAIASINSATSITLDANWLGATQVDKSTTQSYINNLVGAGTQPFQLAMGIHGMRWADKVLSGNAIAQDELIDAADWYRTLGQNDTLRGAYFARGFPNCEPDPSSTSPDDTNCGDGSNRFLHLEFIGALAAAYETAIENDDSRAADLLYMGDRIVGAALDGGLGGPETDGTYASELDETNGSVSEKPKNFGYAFGWGRAWAWDAVRALGLGAVAVIGDYTISGELSF